MRYVIRSLFLLGKKSSALFFISLVFLLFTHTLYAAEKKPVEKKSSKTPSSSVITQPNPLRPAEILYNRRKYPEAIEAAKKTIRKHPDDYKAYYFIGRTLIELKEYKKALGYLKMALEMKPDFHIARVHLGEAYFESGEYKTALKIYKQVAAADLSNVDAVLDIGETYIQLRDYEQGEKYLLKAISMDPEYFSPYNEMGNLCLLRKEYHKALEYYKKSLGKRPDYEDALIGMGKVYAVLKQYRIAENYLEKAIKINEDHCGEALSVMGDIKTATKDYKEAEKYYRRAIKTDKYDSQGYLSLGKLYLLMGKSGDAEKVFLQSLKINPQTANSGEIHYNLALIYAKKRKDKQALIHLKQALKNDSDFLKQANGETSFKYLRETAEYKKMTKKYRK